MTPSNREKLAVAKQNLGLFCGVNHLDAASVLFRAHCFFE